MVEEARLAMKQAYGLLWNFYSDGSSNAKLASSARVLLRDALSREELSEGIALARPICERLGTQFDSNVGGAFGSAAFECGEPLALAEAHEGMEWWNGLSDDERKQWAVRAGNTGRASAAWEAYKRQKAGG